jgi:hypothetical protein
MNLTTEIIANYSDQWLTFSIQITTQLINCNLIGWFYGHEYFLHCTQKFAIFIKNLIRPPGNRQYWWNKITYTFFKTSAHAATCTKNETLRIFWNLWRTSISCFRGSTITVLCIGSCIADTWYAICMYLAID